MAKPSGPKLDRSLVTEPPPNTRERVADEKAAHFPDSPPAPPIATKPRSNPWPTTEKPPARGDGRGAILPATLDEWKEPPATVASSDHQATGDPSPATGETTAKPPEQTDAAGFPMVLLPAYSWEETYQANAEDTGPDPAGSSPLFPGRRPLYKRSEPPASAEEQLADVITFLRKLQANIRHAEPASVAPTPAEIGLSLLQMRRLSRTGVAPDHFEIGVLPKPPKVEPAPPAAAESEPVADGAAVERKELPPPPEPVRLERRHVAWLALTGILCFVTLGLVAYLWMRMGPLSRAAATPRGPAARGTPGPVPEQEISQEALTLANLALEAMQQGDFKRASDILTKAQKQGVVLPGLSYQAALLAFNQGQGQEADGFLERSIAAREAVADCWYLRANTIFFTEGPAQAAEAFEQAVAAAPFNPRFYFFRAECLRRNGNAVAAVGQFQQALRCRPNSTDTELILFKIGLTKIETNTDLIFKTELHDRLAQEPVSGDTLLLAAADAISRSEFPEAADFLKRAALGLPPRVFQSRLRDYVFRAQDKQPDIAAVLKLTLSAAAAPGGQPAPRSGRGLIDPATRSLAEADPAGW